MATCSKKEKCLYNASQLLLFKIKTSRPLYISLDFIRSLHKEVYAYNKPAAGNFRTHVYNAVVGSNTFKPVPPYQIKSKLLDLFEFVNNKRIKPAYYKKYFTSKFPDYNKLSGYQKELWYAIFCASYIHHKIVCIHPFTGGNGRIARLFLSMELAEHGLYRNTFPPLINQVISGSRSQYLDALSSADKGNYLKFCRYLAKVLEKATKMVDLLESEEKIKLSQ